MKKLFIFELDNIVVNTDEYLAEQFGHKFRKELDQDDIRKALQDPNIYYSMTPNKDIVGHIHDLHTSGYPIGFYCERPLAARAFTKRWIKKHIDFKPAFLFCEVDDKANFLFDINGAFEFVVERNRATVNQLTVEGYPVLTLENDEFETWPCLYFKTDGTAMLWREQDKESVPLFEYLEEKEEK